MCFFLEKFCYIIEVYFINKKLLKNEKIICEKSGKHPIQ